MNASPYDFRVIGMLLHNDFRAGWRKHFGDTTWSKRLLQLGGALFLLLFMAGLHLAAFALLVFVLGTGHVTSLELLRGLSGAVWGFLLFVMLSGGLARALVVLHEQEDSDLLLAAPISPRAILVARFFGNALQSCLIDGFIILPWIDVLVWTGHPRYLFGYPVWFALALIITCIDGLFSFGLIRWLGLRKARLYSQVVPFMLVFTMTLLLATYNLSIVSLNGAPTMAPSPSLQARLVQARLVAISHTPLAWIARAAAGNLPFLAVILLLSVVLIAWTLRVIERPFIEGSQFLQEETAPLAPDRRDKPFRSGLGWIDFRRNLRLVTRTPMLLVQCFSQILTPIASSILLVQYHPSAGIAFFTLFAGGVLAGILTIAAGAVEQCPDLLKMAPTSPLRFRLGKIIAGCALPLIGLTAVALLLLIFGQVPIALSLLLVGWPLLIASSLVGETFAGPLKPGQKVKLASDPIMLIPLLGLQMVSGAVACLPLFANAISLVELLAATVACWVLLLIAVGLAQLRKPLFPFSPAAAPVSHLRPSPAALL